VKAASSTYPCIGWCKKGKFLQELPRAAWCFVREKLRHRFTRFEAVAEFYSQREKTANANH